MACGAGMAALSFAICSCVVLASSALLRARVFLEFISTHTFKVPKKVFSEAFEADWLEQYRVHFGLTCLRSGMPDHSFVVTLFGKMGRDCQRHLCDLAGQVTLVAALCRCFPVVVLTLILLTGGSLSHTCPAYCINLHLLQVSWLLDCIGSRL